MPGDQTSFSSAQMEARLFLSRELTGFPAARRRYQFRSHGTSDRIVFRYVWAVLFDTSSGAP